MASTSAVSSMAKPLYCSTPNRVSISGAFFKPLPAMGIAKSKRPIGRRAGVKVQASLKEKAVTGLTAAALTASMVIPEVAEAAGSSLTPSLKNFLLSIVSGGVVLIAILGAVIGVSNFDPVKRS